MDTENQVPCPCRSGTGAQGARGILRNALRVLLHVASVGLCPSTWLEGLVI